jgi:hypothetical protein
MLVIASSRSPTFEHWNIESVAAERRNQVAAATAP